MNTRIKNNVLSFLIAGLVILTILPASNFNAKGDGVRGGYSGAGTKGGFSGADGVRDNFSGGSSGVGKGFESIALNGGGVRGGLVSNGAEKGNGVAFAKSGNGSHGFQDLNDGHGTGSGKTPISMKGGNGVRVGFADGNGVGNGIGDKGGHGKGILFANGGDGVSGGFVGGGRLHGSIL